MSNGSRAYRAWCHAYEDMLDQRKLWEAASVSARNAERVEAERREQVRKAEMRESEAALALYNEGKTEIAINAKDD